MSSNVPEAWRRNYDHSYETMHRIKENDAELKGSTIGDCNVIGGFAAHDVDDLSRLGAAIGENTHLSSLAISNREHHNREYGFPLQLSNKGFFEGLKRNSSIHRVLFMKYRNTDVIREILNVYQQNSKHLTILAFDQCNLPYPIPLQNAGGNCDVNSNLQTIHIENCDITDQQLIPMVEAIKGYYSLVT